MFYAYVHALPGNGAADDIFYVGKGSNNRAWSFGISHGRKAAHRAIVDSVGKKNILVGTIPCSNESLAFQLETGLIKCLRRMGVSLKNLTSGGPGMAGYKKQNIVRQYPY